MNVRTTLDPSEALHECIMLDRVTSAAEKVATLADLGLVACPDLTRTLNELESAQRRARRLGLVLGCSPLRPWLARLIHTQRALRRRLDVALKARQAAGGLPQGAGRRLGQGMQRSIATTQRAPHT